MEWIRRLVDKWGLLTEWHWRREWITTSRTRKWFINETCLENKNWLGRKAEHETFGKAIAAGNCVEHRGPRRNDLSRRPVFLSDSTVKSIIDHSDKLACSCKLIVKRMQHRTAINEVFNRQSNTRVSCCDYGMNNMEIHKQRWRLGSEMTQEYKVGRWSKTRVSQQGTTRHSPRATPELHSPNSLLYSNRI